MSEHTNAVWQGKDLRAAIDAGGVALWSWNVGNDRLTMDDAAFKMWGVPQAENVTFEDLSSRIHPADRDRVRAAFAATRPVSGAYEIDFRIILGEEIRWVSARGQGDDPSSNDGLRFGIFLDVTGRKQAEEANELLAGEMSHRVKNLLALASSLTSLTSRSASNAQDMARDLIDRLAALGRAHDLVRPIPGQQGKATLLGDLLSVLLAPYDGMGAFAGRVRVSVPRMGVGESAATTLALVVHELATNSVKYGALSAATGTLDVSCVAHESDELVLTWTERGGPKVEAPKSTSGFGTKMMSHVMPSLGGSVSTDWSNDGALIKLQFKRSLLAS